MSAPAGVEPIVTAGTHTPTSAAAAAAAAAGGRSSKRSTPTSGGGGSLDVKGVGGASAGGAAGANPKRASGKSQLELSHAMIAATSGAKRSSGGPISARKNASAIAAAQEAAEAVAKATGVTIAVPEPDAPKAETPEERAAREAKEKEEDDKLFPPGFAYDDTKSPDLVSHVWPYQLKSDYVKLHASFGFPCDKRYNLHYLGFGEIVFATGNTVQTLDLRTTNKRVLSGHGKATFSGVAAVAVHPSGQYFAVAERGAQPNVLIYSYPAMEVVRILRKGTERGYSDLTFSPGTGDKLASVGADPDYLLTVWDWARERVLLRTKAFSQDVYRVAFSERHAGKLITSGTGHIRFWKMASTFTGLKLQGAIGKFGNVELSDICSFAELPNGKVISGTESGFLLMWDGNFIQFQISKRGGKPCHDGNVELVHLEMEDDINRAATASAAAPAAAAAAASPPAHARLDSKDSKSGSGAAPPAAAAAAAAAPTNVATIFKEKDSKMVLVTAGADGYVKFWKFDKLEFAETADDDLTYELEPLLEKQVAPGCKIKSMLKGDNHWLIQDEHGALYRLWYPMLNVEKVWDVHAGDITGLALSPSAHVAVTCGVDHTVRCWDIGASKHMYTARYNAPARSLVWAPATVDDESRVIFVGFEDGVVRVLNRYADAFSLLYAFKPHNKPVTDMAISADGTMLATAAQDGSLFFLQIAKKGESIPGTGTGGKPGKPYNPLGFVRLPAPALSLQWDRTSTYLLLACGPDVYQYQKPNPADYKHIADSRDTFEIQLPVRKFRVEVEIKLRKRKAGAPGSRPRIAVDADATEEERARIEEEEKRRDELDEKDRQKRHAERVSKRTPDPVSCVLYGIEPGTFWVTLDAGGTVAQPKPRPGARYEMLYECSFANANAQGKGAPTRTIPLGRDLGTVCSLSYSLSGKYLLIGTRNGGVQMRPVNDIMYWLYTSPHDGERGPVNRVQSSFDDKLLLSVGRDGNFFAFHVDPIGALAKADRSHQFKAAEKAAHKQQQRLEGGLDAAQQAAEGEEEDIDELYEYGPNGKQFAEDEEDPLAPLAAAATAETKQPTNAAEEAEAKRKADAAKAKLAEEAAKAVEEVVVRIPKSRSGAAPPPAVVLPRLDSSDEALAPKSGVSDGADITDATTYSIEDEKLKQEEDERVRNAEDKKRQVRLQIDKMRKQFTELLTQNNALEKSQQLPREAFELDPKLREQLELEAQKKIEDVKAELAWISEKHSIALQKLRAKFLDHVLVEHITLRSFRAPYTSVSSFRTPELPQFLTEAIEEVHRVLTSDENRRRENAGNAVKEDDDGLVRDEDNDDDDPNKQLLSADNDFGFGNDSGAAGAGAGHHKHAHGHGHGHHASGGKHVPRMQFGMTNASPHKHKGHNKALTEPDTRKKSREERKQDLERLRALQPDPTALDPRDLKAVDEAQHNMGDYKLKSADNYKVPEAQRVNMEKKRTQMVMLQESVQLIKMRFNERFLALRDLKERVIRYIQRDNVRLLEINKRLGIDDKLWAPEIDPTEFPEHRDLYTAQDLLDFEREREKERVRLQQKDRPQYLASYAGAGDEKLKALGDRKDGAGGVDDFSGGVHGGAGAGLGGGGGDKKAAREVDRIADHYRSLDRNTVKSDMERADELIARRLLEHERASLLDKIDFAVWTFDDAVAKLRAEKMRADVDLKTTDLKVLTLYQELNVLKEFHDRETRFFQQLQKARDQKNVIRKDMSECAKMLEHKKDELLALHEKKKQNEQDFNDVVGDKKEIYNPLLKIFNKSVKKKKRRGGGGGGAAAAKDGDVGDDSDSDDGKGDGSGDDDDDGDDDGGNAGGGDDDEDADAPPPGCDDKTHQAVLDLRTRRLEIDDAIFEVDKLHAELAMTLEKFHSKEALVDRELARTEADIEELQSEKQRALNAIEVIIPLKLSQIKCLVDGRLPRDISQALIFTSSGLNRLHARISELRAQQERLTRQLAKLQSDEKKKQREVKRTRVWIEEEKAKCREVQLLKFGQTVDLAILEKVNVDEGAADLKQKLKKLENTSVAELAHWDQKISAAKDQLAQVSQLNTQYLERVAQLTEQQYSLEDQLNTTTKNVHVTDSSPVDEKSEGERAQLLQLVQIQEKEIDALKAEIHVLRRKGGQIYTPHS